MAVAIYARKSTESEERQVQSLDDQLRELEQLAKRTGLVVTETVTESKSAKAPFTRPEFQRMVSMIEAGEITGLLTWHINRLARNMLDGGMIAHLLQTGKLQFIMTPQRTYLPEDSALLLAIENGMATSLVQDLSRAVKRGLKGKVERGWYPGRAPLGYRNNKETHEIEPDPLAFPIIKKGWELLLSEGYTVAEVRREMVRLGLTGNSRTTRHKAPCPSVLYKLFSNPFYAGFFSHGGGSVAGRHPAMISMEDFERAQRLVGRKGSRRKRTHTHAFSGMFWCPACGCRMVGETKRKSYKQTGREVAYVYYHCTGAKGCPKNGVREEVVEEALFRFVEQLAVPPAFVAWMKEEVLRQAESDLTTLAASVARLDHQVEEVGLRLERIREMRISGELPAAEYAELKLDAENTRRKLESQRKATLGESERASAHVFEKLKVNEWAGQFRELTAEHKRGLLQSVAEKCFLTLESLTFQLDPVIAKIAAFEPLNIGYQKSKTGDSCVDVSLWQGQVDDVLSLARQKARSQRDSNIEAPQPVELVIRFADVPGWKDSRGGAGVDEEGRCSRS